MASECKGCDARIPWPVTEPPKPLLNTNATHLTRSKMPLPDAPQYPSRRVPQAQFLAAVPLWYVQHPDKLQSPRLHVTSAGFVSFIRLFYDTRAPLADLAPQTCYAVPREARRTSQ